MDINTALQTIEQLKAELQKERQNKQVTTASGTIVILLEYNSLRSSTCD